MRQKIFGTSEHRALVSFLMKFLKKFTKKERKEERFLLKIDKSAYFYQFFPIFLLRAASVQLFKVENLFFVGCALVTDDSSAGAHYRALRPAFSRTIDHVY